MRTVRPQSAGGGVATDVGKHQAHRSPRRDSESNQKMECVLSVTLDETAARIEENLLGSLPTQMEPKGL